MKEKLDITGAKVGHRPEHRVWTLEKVYSNNSGMTGVIYV